MSVFLLLLSFDEVTDLIAKLRATTDVVQRYDFENQIGRLARPGHIPVLLKEIDTGPDTLRPHFIRPIRTIGGKEAVAALRGIVVKYDWRSRGEAAYALKLLGDDGGVKYLAGEFAKPTLTKEDRLAIVQYLFAYYYNGKDAALALRKVLESEKDEVLRRRIIDALVSHKDPDTLPLLRKIAGDASDPVRHDALAALIKLGDAGAIDRALEELEKGKIPLASLNTVLFALQLSGSRDLVDRLLAVLEKVEETNTRLQIIRTLANLKDPKALALLTKLAEAKDATVADAAMDAILSLAGRLQVESIRKILKHESVDRRLRAAGALLALDDLSGLPVIEAELRNPSSAYRSQAVTALQGCHRKEVVPLFLLAMSDKDAIVRQNATTYLMSALQALNPYLKFDLSKLGYDPKSEDAAAREAGLEKIRAWWDQNKPK